MNELSRRIGKFDSPESLLKAYERLEAEFSKRCQKLKEFEKENGQLKSDLNDNQRYDKYAVTALANEGFVAANVLPREDIRRKVIDDYLTALTREGSAYVLRSDTGKSALTPPAKPGSLAEAKRLAEMIINS
ncbi:MAG: hypothetical protein FWE84_01245 [Firmicutes bacterium]|nr:hypothetical protein [Bacillota bacterium]